MPTEPGDGVPTNTGAFTGAGATGAAGAGALAATCATCCAVTVCPVAWLTAEAICAWDNPKETPACNIACCPAGVPMLALMKADVPAGKPASESFIALVTL